MSKDFDGDNQRLQAVYEETNRLLQTLVRKAEAIERRQIDVAKGRERLSIARTRAEETMAELIADRRLRDYTRSILLNAWTDVLVLTELRNGADSQNWQAQKRIAESLIAVDDPSDVGHRRARRLIWRRMCRKHCSWWVITPMRPWPPATGC